jgi:hypothetical protein
MVQRSSRDYVPTADGANNNTMAEVIGNKTDTGTSGDSIVSLTKKNNTDILVIDAFHDVPSTDSADNVVMSDVIGNKNDTASGSSLFSNVGKIAADIMIPSQDAADNNTSAEVIGNKTDSKNGTSLVALQQQDLDRSGLPSQDSANNNVFADVIGNKTDSKNGDSIYAIVGKIQDRVSAAKAEGTFSYLDAGGEVDIIEITPVDGEQIDGIWIDLVNMTQNGTIKLYSKIDGSNYRQVSISGTIQSYAFTVADGVDGVYIPGPFSINTDFKVSYEEGANEGADRAIPFRVIRRQFVIA